MQINFAISGGLDPIGLDCAEPEEKACGVCGKAPDTTAWWWGWGLQACCDDHWKRLVAEKLGRTITLAP